MHSWSLISMLISRLPFIRHITYVDDVIEIIASNRHVRKSMSKYLVSITSHSQCSWSWRAHYTYHSPQRAQIEKVTYFNVPTFHYHLLWPKTYPKSTFFKQNTSSKGNNLCFIVLYPYCKKWLKNDQFHPFHLVSSCYFLDFGVLWVWSETILLGNWQLHIIISTKMPS